MPTQAEILAEQRAEAVFLAERKAAMATECAALETPTALAWLAAHWTAKAADAEAVAAKLQARKPFSSARSTRAQLVAEGSARTYHSLAAACQVPATQRSYAQNVDIAALLPPAARGEGP